MGLFGKKKPSASSNPEVRKAMDKRDELIADMKVAVKNVDDLIRQYEEANGYVHEERDQ